MYPHDRAVSSSMLDTGGYPRLPGPRPPGVSSMPTGFSLGNIRPGERLPPGAAVRLPTGNGMVASAGGVRPGQVFQLPGYTRPPAQYGSPRPVMTFMQHAQSQRPSPPPTHASIPYQPRPPAGHGPPPRNFSGPQYNQQQQYAAQSLPQQRSVTSPVPTPGPAQYDERSRMSSQSSHSSLSGSTRSHPSRSAQTPPMPFPTGSIMPPEPRITRTPPLDDTSVRTRSDSPHDSQAGLNGRTDSMSSSAVGANEVGVSANTGGAGKNPLVDLVETEKLFVERLGLIVRKVAAAWSRTNLPPPALDKMFRSIEGVYKCSRGFLTRLESIGLNPSSPKILGDLLIQWIDDLSAPYERYSENYMINFDSHPAITTNSQLGYILNDLTMSHPPPLTSSSPTISSSRSNPVWIIDLFFILPLDRLQYYRKLYDKLLRSTREGKSDWKLLKRSCEKLEVLVEGVENKLGADVNVTGDSKGRFSVASSRMDSSSVEGNIMSPMASMGQTRTSDGSGGSSKQYPSSSDRHASDPIEVELPIYSPTPQDPIRSLTPVERSSNTPLTDLEVRLDTNRAIDLFTMKPKQCRLQMAPPTLAFRREQRKAADCMIYFTPTSTRKEVIHRRSQVLILSDLFLMCEHMTATEKAQKAQEVLRRHPERAGDGSPFPEMWLCYPPLAGRHLTATTGGVENELVVGVMGREKFLLVFESREVRDEVLEDMEACIQFAGTVGKSSTSRSAPVSPMPDMQPNGRGLSLHSLQTALPLVPPKEATHNRRPSSEAASLSTLPPRNASLRSPIPHDGPTYPIGPYPTGTYTPSPPLTQSGNRPPERNLYSPNQQYANGGMVPPRSAPLTTQNPHSVPYPMQAFRSHDGHTRQNPGNPPPSGYQHHLGAHQGLRHAQSTEGLRVNRPSPQHLTIPSPIERGSYDDDLDDSPISPVDAQPVRDAGPAVISAQMKCKVFLKQSHQQWKALGGARLKLYIQTSTNIKQLVVESDNKDKTMLISTIVLTDGVERVAKTGVAVEISDVSGARTGIIYMIQLRNEESAGGLFDSLIAGSDRASGGMTPRRGR